MAYTRHGHQIPHSPADENKPSLIARCGGPTLCEVCAKDAVEWHTENSMGLHVTTDRPFLPPLNDLQEIARREVFYYVKRRLEKTDTHVTFAEDEVYVVWWSKVLQNWKALVSTTLPDGMYYEVTFNGDKGELYIDAYKKFDNERVDLSGPRDGF